MSVIDTDTFAVTATIETGQGAHGIVIDRSSRHAHVTNIYSDDVAVLDLAELEVAARIPVGDKPNGISFSTLPVEERENVTLRLPDSVAGAQDDMQGHDGPATAVVTDGNLLRTADDYAPFALISSTDSMLRVQTPDPLFGERPIDVRGVGRRIIGP